MADDPNGIFHVGFHDLVFLLGQAAGLIEDMLGNTDFADVVEQRRFPDHFHMVRIQVDGACEFRGVMGDIVGMVEGIVILGVDGGGQGVNRTFIFRIGAVPVRCFRRCFFKAVIPGRIREDGVFSVVFDVIHRHVRVIDELLDRAGRVRDRANPSADGQDLEGVVGGGLVHIEDLPPDVLGQLLGGEEVIAWQDDRKFFPAVTGDMAVLSHTRLDQAGYFLQGDVAFLVAVELIVQLEIVEIEDDEGETLIPDARHRRFARSHRNICG